MDLIRPWWFDNATLVDRTVAGPRKLESQSNITRPADISAPSKPSAKALGKAKLIEPETSVVGTGLTEDKSNKPVAQSNAKPSLSRRCLLNPTVEEPTPRELRRDFRKQVERMAGVTNHTKLALSLRRSLEDTGGPSSKPIPDGKLVELNSSRQEALVAESSGSLQKSSQALVKRSQSEQAALEEAMTKGLVSMVPSNVPIYGAATVRIEDKPMKSITQREMQTMGLTKKK